MFSHNSISNPDSIGTEVYLMGKLNFIKDPLSNKQLPLLECLDNGKYIVYWIEEGNFAYDITSKLFEKAKETTFILECKAILLKNNVLHVVESIELYKTYGK